MGQHQIKAPLFLLMIQTGADYLSQHVNEVNALNVFPVPDGDTGTNMNLTLMSGVREMEKHTSDLSIGKLADAFSKGLLMGARGNSGVILSQLFRGFAKALSGKETIDARELAEAFVRGVETAYKAVIKPVEGTILTVSREAADAGLVLSRKTDDPKAIVQAILEGARKTLVRTPEMLPVLKQANVVDAGGQGLVFVYEGILAALKGEVASRVPERESLAPVHSESFQIKHDPEEVEFGYCTEFIVRLGINHQGNSVKSFDESAFRTEMSRFGDSLLVIADDDVVKVHVHSETPGEALNHAMTYGDLIRIKIDNMREQVEKVEESHAHTKVKKKYGVIAVATGDGIAEIFTSLGVDVVISGGQTMNPSTEDLVNAVKKIAAEHVIILPNNKNIILTAEQVGELVEGAVTVLPTKTIPQGLAAMLAFQEDSTPEENKMRMGRVFLEVQTGEVTYAVRDSSVDNKTIQAGDFLGLLNGKIETVGNDLLQTSTQLLQDLLQEEAQVLTIFKGQDAMDEQVSELQTFVETNYPEVEVEIQYGGQPLYFFIFAVE